LSRESTNTISRNENEGKQKNEKKLMNGAEIFVKSLEAEGVDTICRWRSSYFWCR